MKCSCLLPTLLLTTFSLCSGVNSAHAVTLFSAAGSSPAVIQSSVDNFRNALGVLNPFVPEEFADGRRQINWDAAPAAVSSPNSFPSDFFNFSSAPRARGIEFTTPGTGFALSGDLDDGTPVRFANINPTYADEFQAFSEERLFTPQGSNLTEVTFFSSADQTTPALSDGFGAVFVDVDLAGASKIEYFDINGNSLLALEPAVADKGLSFIGAKFDSNVLASVLITTGNRAIGPIDGESGFDIVVLDDFIYGEPVSVPEPTTAMLFLGGLSLAYANRRRHG